MLPVSSLVAPCDPGAAPGTYATIHWDGTLAGRRPARALPLLEPRSDARARMPIDLTEARENCDVGPPVAAQPLPPGVTPGAGVTVRGIRWQLDAVVAHPDRTEPHLRGGDPPVRQVLLWPVDRPGAPGRVG